MFSHAQAADWKFDQAICLSLWDCKRKEKRSLNSKHHHCVFGVRKSSRNSEIRFAIETSTSIARHHRMLFAFRSHPIGNRLKTGFEMLCKFAERVYWVENVMISSEALPSASKPQWQAQPNPILRSA
jgi:hypothetical protein